MIRHTLRLARTAVIVIPAYRRRKLARALERLGPSYIKLGQTLSTRPDIIGVELAADLASLRDNLPPFPAREARRIVEEDLGAPIDTLFAAFDDEPVAAASIAQVHRATLHDGKRVAVKILRPGIHRRFKRDLDFFRWGACIIERRRPHLRRLKPVEVVQTLEESVIFELDLRYEAAAMQEMHANIQKHSDTGFRVPNVEWRMVSERVLVSEWIDGAPIHEAATHNPDALLATLSQAFFRHVFRDGFFHADMHPGNLFVDAKGDLVAVDFGIMGRLEWRERIFIAEIFRGFLNEDYKRVAEAHFKAGYVPAHHSVERFAQAAMAIAKPILDRPVHEISLAKLLGQLFNVAETFEMETQPQLLLLQKTLVVVEGVGRMLNPNVNMWEMARPPIEEWARDTFSLRGRAHHAAQELRELAVMVPLLLKRLEEALKE